MQRRKFIVGMGSLAAGSAAAMGTGAFSSATVKDREAWATVVADNAALLRLDPSVSNHAQMAGNDELIIDLQDLNQNAEFTFDTLIRIYNEGNQPVDISVSVDSGLDSAVDAVPGDGGPGVSDSPNLRTTSVTVGPGEYVDVGAEVTTTSGTGSFNPGTFTIHAN